MKAFLSIILLLAFGVGVWGNTPEQIAEAQDLSREMIEANPKLLGED